MTALLHESDVPDVVTLAARAPSVHNIQPARWRFTENQVTLFRALDRTLPVADPEGNDVTMSLGAAFEGTSLALSERNLALDEIRLKPDETAAGCASIAKATIIPGGVRDPLAAYVTKRRSFRGKFAAFERRDVSRIKSIEADDAIIIVDRSTICDIATAHREASWMFEKNEAYHRELWSWLRLSPQHSSWKRDGLNADCLSLSEMERTAARVLLSPLMFSGLSRLGIAKRLVSEEAQVRSAGALVVFAPLKAVTSFDAGRRFYRLWLEITAGGYNAVPMSASADDPLSNATIAALVTLSRDRRIANVFRVGRPGTPPPAMSPRLPASELLV